MAQDVATEWKPPEPHGTGHDSFLTSLRRAVPWWLLPVTVVTVLSAFILYGLWTAFFAKVGIAGPYLSPFYSPLINRYGPVTPALYVLPFPLLFRASCYYYRKAYYRSFFWDPPACAIGELRKKPYRGETRFPLILNNLHRFALYCAVVVVIFLWIDAFASLDYQGHLYLGIGTVILFVNCLFLSCYTFGCHSMRHLVGGCLDCYSKIRGGGGRYRGWRGVTKLNEHHAFWAWMSLFSVVAADVYIRLMQAGMHDPHILVK